MQKNKLRVIIAILCTLIFLGCKKKNDDYNLIPDVVVNEVLYLSQPQYFSLGVVNGWAYVNGGSKGIIVYRKNIDEFMAFERHSPYNSDQNCSVVNVDSTNLVGVEMCDSSTYSLFNGTVISGKATIPLKQYGTELSGDVLRIFN